ncbi:MAG: S41 family peptidase [Spirosomataceae bacterium]
MKNTVLWLLLLLVSACAGSYHPDKIYTSQQLRKDFGILRQALESGHPGMYLYTSKDSMNYWFERTYQQLDHDMTEREFRVIINPLVSYVRCGHTDVMAPKAAARYHKKHKIKTMPLQTIVGEGRAWINQNLSNDSTIRKGNELLAVDSLTVRYLVGRMRDMHTSDGYNISYKDNIIAGSFPVLYRYLYGDRDSVWVTIRDSLGQVRSRWIGPKKAQKVAKAAPRPPASPAPTPPKPAAPTSQPPKKLSKAERRRTFKFSDKDSTTAVLDINTFSDNTGKRFYRKTFEQLAQHPQVQNLIIDLRANGGGLSAASADLMSYLLKQPYKYYASATARFRKPSFNKYLDQKMSRLMIRTFFAHPLPNGGMEHRWSGKVFQPRKKYHFDGKVYVLVNGATFSAASIFSSVTQGQQRVTVIGRETGGGRKSCNANFMANLTLPETKARVRFPLFHLTFDAPGDDIGHGVFPDIPVKYTSKDLLAAKDLDIEKAYELIRKSRGN